MARNRSNSTESEADSRLLEERIAELDELIRERTRELTRANRELQDEIEERELISEELRKNEEKYRAVVDQSAEYIYLIDAETLEFIEANPVFREMLGYSDEEFAKLTLYELVDADRESIDRNIAKVVQDGSLFIGPRKYRAADGALVDAELSVNVITYGGRKAMCVVARDLRERLALEEQLRQSQKMEAVGTLAGGVAHDFNNLLFVISGRCDMALRKLADDAPARAEIEDVALAAERAQDLTRQLLAFSRKQVLRPRVLDLNDTLKRMERMLRPLIGGDVALRVDLAPAPQAVRADPGQIEQVVMNLAVNARDAMPDGGTLTVGIRPVPAADVDTARRHGLAHGPLTEIRVSDDGLGMDANTRARIFEPFFTTKAAGSGLGLSTVYGIVKQSGGSIEVESEPERGTTFRIYLPTVADEVDTPPPPFPREPDRQRGSGTILVVEDDPMTRRLVADVLGGAGYSVLQATSAEEALALVDDGNADVDLLLTDIVLPRMSGRDLVERLERDGVRLAVLYMSGYTDDAAVRGEITERELPFMQKPFAPEELLARVRGQLRDS